MISEEQLHDIPGYEIPLLNVEFEKPAKIDHELLMKLLKGELRKEYYRQINSSNY